MNEELATCQPYDRSEEKSRHKSLATFKRPAIINNSLPFELLYFDIGTYHIDMILHAMFMQIINFFMRFYH